MSKSELLVGFMDKWELAKPPVLINSEEEAAQLLGISIVREEDERLQDEAEVESQKTGIYRTAKHEEENIEEILDDISELAHH